MTTEHDDSMRDLLPWYINDTLAASTRAKVAAHLLTCLACQHEFAHWRTIARAIAAEARPTDNPVAASATRAAIHHALATTPAQTKGLFPMNDAPQPIPERDPRPTRRSVFPVAAVLLMVLIIASSVWFARQRNGASPGAATATATAVAHPSPICDVKNVFSSTNTGSQSAQTGQSVTVHGITVTLKGFYMDFTRTLVSLNVHTTQSLQNSSYQPSSMTIMLASGKTLSFGGAAGGSYDGGEHDWRAFGLSKEALPLDVFGTEQKATIIIPSLDQGPLNHVLAGPWQLPFTFNTPPPRSVNSLTCGAQTFEGYQVVPTSVAVVPAATQADGYPGGIKLTLCLTGPHVTEHDAVSNFDIFYSGKEWAGIGNPDINPTQSSVAILTIQGKQLQPQFAGGGDACTVGSVPGKTSILTYLTPLPSPTGHVIFTVPSLLYGFYSSGGALGPIAGPWHYEFDLK